jgi:hypothetical protein
MLVVLYFVLAIKIEQLNSTIYLKFNGYEYVYINIFYERIFLYVVHTTIVNPVSK